jgi:uncharacterized protein
MKKLFRTALAIGFAVSAAFVHSQAAPPPDANATASPQSTPPAIPTDQQPTKQQLAKLFEAMHIREQMTNVMQSMTGMVQQQMRQQIQAAENAPGAQKTTPEQQAALEDIMSRFIAKAMNIFTVDEMLDDMATIYQRHFTRADVDAYIAFYSTPAGKDLLQITPVIMQEYMPVVMQRVQDRSRELTQELTREIDGVLKSSAPDATAPPAPAPK